LLRACAAALGLEMDVAPDSEVRLLWRRLFADFSMGFKKLLFYLVVAGLPIIAMFACMFASIIVYGDASELATRRGIHPLESSTNTWLAVFFAWPFLHFGWPHLLGNAPFAFALGFFICLRGVVDFIVVFCLSTWVGGLGVFLLGGPNSVHAGASGVIMGCFAALVLRVIFERSLVSLFWAAVVAVWYGSLFYILIPSSAYSWQGHLFGFLGGAAAAAILGVWGQRRERARAARSNEIGSEVEELTRFDDLKLDQNVDRLASESAMFAEVHQQMKSGNDLV
jgi:membrane associated rhomboid family serine protease